MINNTSRKFDLSDRTENFGITIIKFASRLPRNTITNPLISQFVRAGTSIGANYSEADNAESKNDFIHKIGIVCKESKETIYWAKMLKVACELSEDTILPILNEAKELNLIFNAIIKSALRNK